MRKHTPGPWRAVLNDHPKMMRWEVWDSQPYPGIRICPVNCAAMDMDHNEANARLIATAPELLAAAQKTEKLHALVEQLAGAYRGYLPHENAGGEFVSGNPELSVQTRTRLALIEHVVQKADAILTEIDAVIAKTGAR